MIAISPDYSQRLIDAGNTQVVGNDIPPVDSVFDLKSGVRAKLVYRNGSMVIVEVREYRSDWIEWSEVKARIAQSGSDSADHQGRVRSGPGGGTADLGGTSSMLA
jgi:hypothetical protein